MIINVVGSYLETLTATNTICSELGDTFSFGTNLFIGIEPVKSVSTVTVIPFGGSPPNTDGERQTTALQLRLRTNNRYKSLAVQQAMIDNLDMNTLNGNGFMRANSSAPMIIGSEANDKWIISVSNFTIKYIKT